VPGVRRAVAQVAGALPDCGAWNSLVEERQAPAARRRRRASRATPRQRRRPAALRDIDTVSAARLSTGIDEFDRVLGGGVVPGSLVLIGGEPGIGKSTLLLQAAAHFARAVGPCSTAPARSRSTRSSRAASGSGSAPAPLYVLAETCLERISRSSPRLRPAFVIVDSIQTVFSLKFQSAPGSIGQVREAATQLLFAAKGQNIPTFLVGHVTKDGSLAGPKALEHIVDTVLYFEGEKHHAHRDRSGRSRTASAP
jgi:DNA repair protein RadA/Sms